jgi:hypothetical protein
MQCDDEQHCKQCPAQSLESPGDYWKVLGCHRGELSNLVDNFVPGMNILFFAIVATFATVFEY